MWGGGGTWGADARGHRGLVARARFAVVSVLSVLWADELMEGGREGGVLLLQTTTPIFTHISSPRPFLFTHRPISATTARRLVD